jgi:hypothetical protein
MISSMLSGALAHNEMVRSYEHAGFTRQEAIQITTDLLLGHQRIQAEIAAEEKRRAEEQKRANER